MRPRYDMAITGVAAVFWCYYLSRVFVMFSVSQIQPVWGLMTCQVQRTGEQYRGMCLL